jgi:hypothetical protein
MNKVDLTSAIQEIVEVCIDSSRSPRFLFLVGAGISAPSIPLASEITEKCKVLAQGRGRKDEPRGTLPIDSYSHWFERAFPQPAHAYLAIAALALRAASSIRSAVALLGGEIALPNS